MPSEEELIIRAALWDPKEALKAWDCLLGGGEFHDLSGAIYRALPTVYSNLRQLDIKPPHLDQLKGSSRHAWVQNISRWRALVPLLEILNSEKIDYRLLKGVAVSCLTNSFSTRVMGDIDILLNKKDSSRILEILKDLGAKPKLNVLKDDENSLWEPWQLFVHENAIDLDIHLADPSDANFYGKVLSSAALTVHHQNMPVLVPEPEWLFIHSALHGQRGSSLSDSLQAILDGAKLIPLSDPVKILRLAATLHAEESLLKILRAQPQSTVVITDLIRSLESQKRKNISARRVHRLLSIHTFNPQNLKKTLHRRPAPELLSIVRRQPQGRKWLYWAWLKLGQISFIEKFCIAHWGGFLDLPPTPISPDQEITISAKELNTPDASCVSTGSIMGHDFRVRIRLPKPNFHGQLFLGYEFSSPVYWGLYINGIPMGLLPLPGRSPGVYPISSTRGSVELSIRSTINNNEGAVDSIRIRIK